MNPHQENRITIIEKLNELTNQAKDVGEYNVASVLQIMVSSLLLNMDAELAGVAVNFGEKALLPEADNKFIKRKSKLN